MLSGYILAYKYLPKFKKRKITKRDFWVARIARIYPLHLLTLFIAVPLTFNEFFIDKIKYLFKFFVNLFLLQSYFPWGRFYFSFNGPSWSISDEAFFYLIFPFLIFLILINKKLFIFLVTILVLSVIILMQIIPEKWSHYLFYINPFIRSLDFMIGILGFLIYAKIKEKKIYLNFNWLEIASVFLFILFFIFHEKINPVYRYSVYYWIPIFLIILVFSFQKGLLSNFLSKKWFIILGEISYAFYLFHQLVLRYSIKYFKGLLNDLSLIVFVLIITLIVSLLSYNYYEKPLNRYIRSKFSKLH